MVPIGRDLVAWMDTWGVNVRTLAAKAGISPRTITRYRQSNSKPQFDEAQRLAVAIAEIEAERGANARDAGLGRGIEDALRPEPPPQTATLRRADGAATKIGEVDAKPRRAERRRVS